MVNLATVFISYYSVKRITKSRYIGFIFSGVYTLCLYRLVNIYLRGSTGEVISMAFIPLVMLGIYEIIRRDYKYWYLFAIGVTGIIQSHIPTTFLAACFTISFCLLNIKHLNKKRIFALLKSALMILGLNMWFIIPFFTYYSYVEFPPRWPFRDTAVYLTQLFSTFVTNTGYELGVRGTTFNEMPLTLGGVIGMGLIAFLYIIVFNKNKITGIEQMGKTTLGYGLFALFAASVFFPWYEIKFLRIFFQIQFVWRFLVIAAPLLSFSASIGIYLLLKKLKIKKNLSVFIAICICITGSYHYMDSVINTRTVLHGPGTIRPSIQNDYIYRGSNLEYTINNADVPIAGESIEIVSTVRYFDGFTVLWTISKKDEIIDEDRYIEFPVYNFPGYAAMSSSNILPVLSGTNNFVRVYLPHDTSRGTVRLFYRGLNRFIIGDVISCLTFLVLLGFILGKRLKNFKLLLKRRGIG